MCSLYINVTINGFGISTVSVDSVIEGFSTAKVQFNIDRK
jgi:hypothetical protein